jgi:DnaK suppressor protein
MEKEKLEHFRGILMGELRRHTEHIREEQANGLQASDDGVKDAADMSMQDVSQETAFRLGERESQMVAEIDEALLRIDEGSYGICARCGKTIEDRRLEAMPWARYDAQCQTLLESLQGDETPSL